MKVDNAPDEWVKLARAVFARNTEVPPDKLPLTGWFIAREEMAMRAALAAVAPLIAAAERERVAGVLDNIAAQSIDPSRIIAFREASAAIRALD